MQKSDGRFPGHRHILKSVMSNLADKSVCVKECVHGNNCKHKENDCRNDNTYNLNSLEPNLVIPTYSLEHAPETVAEVEPYCYEPYDIDNEYPYASECVHEEGVRILSFASAEFEELHLSPEVGKVEEQDTENYDSEYEHVLCRP